MNLIIRPARMTDADVICEFNRLMAKETENKDLDPGDRSKRAWRRCSAIRQGTLFRRGGGQARSSASSASRCEWSDWRNGNFWWIQSVYVARGARRQGVFRELFEHLLQAARCRSRTSSACGCMSSMTIYVAQATYRQAGDGR